MRFYVLNGLLIVSWLDFFYTVVVAIVSCVEYVIFE